MAASNLNIQPRSKPLKPHERAIMRQQIAAQQEHQAMLAAQEEATQQINVGASVSEDPYAEILAAQASVNQSNQPAFDMSNFIGAPNTPPSSVPVLPHQAAAHQTVAPMPFPVGAANPLDVLAGITPDNAATQHVGSNPQLPTQVVVINTPPAPAPTPPHTVQQLAQSRWGVDQDFPDLADIFSGRSNIKPIGGLPPAPAPSAPILVQHVTVVHEVPAKPAGYKMLRAVDVYLNGQMVHFEMGQVVYDTWVIQPLIESGFDSMVPIEETRNFLGCPCGCGHWFPTSAALKQV